MRTATLSRKEFTAEGTFGHLVLDDATEFFTGELPWRDNHGGVSCIPKGEYLCKWIFSRHHGKWLYEVTNVADRTAIEIHAANFMGDRTKGFKCELLGCIALGKSVGQLGGQTATLQSVVAVTEFEKNLNKEDFALTITEV